MKPTVLALLWMGSALLAPALAAGPSATSGPAAAASSSATTAVQAAERAQEPGNLRPAQPVVPQITIPLKSRGAERSGPTTPGEVDQDGIDDDAARCAAQKTRRERVACKNPKPHPVPVRIK